MRVRPEERAIGSDFETIDQSFLRDSPAKPPWELPDCQVEYFQTGRQALICIERELTERGYSALIVPSHLCDSMIEPFFRMGWEIVPVRMDKNISVDLTELDRVLGVSAQPAAVMMAEYFGRIPNKAQADYMAGLAERGIPLISDETHRPFTPGSFGAEFAVGSLRKVFPVADGAYLRRSLAVKAPPPSARVSKSETWDAPRHRWQAMDAKRAFGLTNDVRNLFVDANASLEAQLSPSPISTRSLRLLQLLNYTELSNRRRQNSSVLYRMLQEREIKVLNPPNTDSVPSHLVIRLRRPTEVRNELASRGIFCPVHWERSEILGGALPWREDLLSIPIDHRYEEADIRRVFNELTEVVAA